MISNAIKLSLATLALASLAACASPKAGSTSITSADAPASEKASPAGGSATTTSSPSSSSATETSDRPAPDGELVCRATTNDGTTELYLKWGDDGARGTLRTIAPSGSVSDLRVHAERFKGRIIADEPGNQDLVKHAAVVSEASGKKQIRIEDMGTPRWLDCD